MSDFDLLADFLRDQAQGCGDDPVIVSLNARAGLILAQSERYWPLLHEVGFSVTAALLDLAVDDSPARLVVIDINTQSDDSST